MYKNRCPKSINIIDINRFNLPISEVGRYRSHRKNNLPINKIIDNRWLESIVIDNNRQKVIIEFYRKSMFLKLKSQLLFFIDLYRLISEWLISITIDYYRLSAYELPTSAYDMALTLKQVTIYVSCMYLC